MKTGARLQQSLTAASQRFFGETTLQSQIIRDQCLRLRGNEQPLSHRAKNRPGAH